MGDREKTLRERFPIYCNVCKQMILPTQYNDEGVVTAEAEPCRVIGMTVTYPDGPDKGVAPMNLYGHLYCLGIQQVARAHSIVHTISACDYCGKELHSGDACPECLERIRKESQKRPTEEIDAVAELMRNLARMRLTPEVLELAPAPEVIPPHTPGATGGTGLRQNPPALAGQASGLLESPERLGEYVPTNELGVVFVFGRVIGALGYKMAYMDGHYPDCVLISPAKLLVRVEFEYQASNFIAHKHDPELCDLVVCWNKDRDLPIHILALGQYFDMVTGAFDFATLQSDGF